MFKNLRLIIYIIFTTFFLLLGIIGLIAKSSTNNKIDNKNEVVSDTNIICSKTYTDELEENLTIEEKVLIIINKNNIKTNILNKSFVYTNEEDYSAKKTSLLELENNTHTFDDEKLRINLQTKIDLSIFENLVINEENIKVSLTNEDYLCN